ncbi:MAG: glycosyltransferase family A protein [Nitrososphaerota archaeon]
MRGPLVTAAVISYNAEKTISRALSSIFAQTYKNIEVILVDSGPGDTTKKIVTSHFPEVKYIFQEKSGAPAAANEAVQQAKGEFVAFLHADDEWLPHKTELQMQVLQRHPGISVLQCGFWVVKETYKNENVDVKLVGKQEVELKEITFREWFTRRAFCWTGSVPSGWLFKRSFFLEQGGFALDSAPGEDWEFLLRITGRGYTVATMSLPLFKYYEYTASASHSTSGVLKGAKIIPQIMSRYDPRGEGGEADWLSVEEYELAIQKEYFHRAWILLRNGNSEERSLAQKYLQEAIALAQKYNRRDLWRWRIASWCPELYIKLHCIKNIFSTYKK